MPQPRYRFRLPDGQVHEATLPFITRTYPEAVMTHRIKTDAAGDGVALPYHGMPSEERAEEAAQDTIPAPVGDDGAKKTESSVKVKRSR